MNSTQQAPQHRHGAGIDLSNSRDVVVVLRDLGRAPLGKAFTLNADGTVSKQARVSVACAEAVIRHVPTADDLASVIREISGDDHAALILDRVKGIDAGTPFRILSERELARALEVDPDAPGVRAKLAGVHDIKIGGVTLPTIARLKENFVPGSWMLLDRDLDEHTPQKFHGDYNEWLVYVDQLVPGVAQVDRVRVGSSSARVFRGDSAVGRGNGHTFVRVVDPDDRERMRVAIQLRALMLGLAWKKPRRSRSSGKVIGHQAATVVDHSVLVLGRLVFDGAPTVGEGLTLRPAEVAVLPGATPALDTRGATTPDADAVESAAAALGLAIRVSQSRAPGGADDDPGAGGLRIDQYDLELGTEIEVQGLGVTTPETLMVLGGTFRCQAPFRASESWAAKFNVAADGRPFVHDVGTGANHWLRDEDWTPIEQERLALEFDLVVLSPREVADSEAAQRRNSERAERVARAAIEKARVAPQLQAKAQEGEFGARCVIEQLRRMIPEQVPVQWAALSVGLPKAAAQQVVDEVHRLTGRGKNTLKAELTDARKVSVKAHRRASLADDADGRRVIEYRPADSVEQARLALQAMASRAGPGELVVFGGALARVAEKEPPFTQRIDGGDQPPPSVPTMASLERVDVLAQVQRAVVFAEVTELGPRPIGVPQQITEIILGLSGYDGLPTVTGLLTHPVVMPNGAILSTGGLHRSSGLFLTGADLGDLRAYSQVEAVHALGRLRTTLLEGFEFASELDADVALAGLITGVQRKVLPAAPGLGVVASVQASGKTTLLRMIHAVLTGRDMPVVAFSAGDESEVRKHLLALLLGSPAMVVFDNISDGLTFRSASVAAAMTAPAYGDRVLGQTRHVEAPTNTLFAFSGNNLSLGADEATRWLLARMAPPGVRPQERRFRNSDVLAFALGLRDQALRDVIGIVAGYIAAGAPEVAGAVGSRFPAWDRLVRRPLLWAGGSDMAEAFRRNESTSEELVAHRGLVGLLRLIFMDTEFRASSVVRAIEGFDTGACSEEFLSVGADKLDEVREALREALGSLQVKDVRSASQIGFALKKKVGAATLGDDGCVLTLSSRNLHGSPVYRVLERRNRPEVGVGGG